MISGAASCFPNASISSSSQGGLQMYNIPQLADHEDITVSSSLEAAGSHSSSLLYNLSILKDKVHQVQSLVSIIISPDQANPADQSTTTSLAIASMGSLVQEIIVTASSMIFISQQMSLGTTSSSSAGNNNNISTIDHQLHQHQQHQADFNNTRENCVENIVQERGGGQGIYSWYAADNCNSNRSLQVVSNIIDDKMGIRRELPRRSETSEGSRGISPKNDDIIELDAADLLAKYTHYCQVCGKGFKRDANLRMHMRAHGDEYKTSAALSNPMKKNHDEGSGGVAGSNCSTKLPKKYSCPQEGCRWNQRHAKFQPLKSMICVKNHYKRSHCPKMYMCKRCNRKQFSVLSDLRTHEKHCGDLKWQCSCGTTFSRKDKLMGHVALFVGHTPVATTLTKQGQPQHQSTSMQLDDT